VSELRKNRDYYGKGQDVFMQKNVDLVNQYLVNMETYTMKDLKRLRVKEFPPNHTWFNSSALSFG